MALERQNRALEQEWMQARGQEATDPGRWLAMPEMGRNLGNLAWQEAGKGSRCSGGARRRANTWRKWSETENEFSHGRIEIRWGGLGRRGAIDHDNNTFIYS